MRMQTGNPTMDLHPPPEDKIGLFRPLFRGRDDVCPRRLESRRTGRSDYAPACANEWVRGVGWRGSNTNDHALAVASAKT